ncbi:hypothetical protein [Thalassovita aquimarina]
MRFALLLSRTLLVLALVLLGTIPDGMMRQAGADGVRLVLCTSHGPKEVWLREDGSTIPAADEAGRENGRDAPHCVQVSLGSQNALPTLAAPGVRASLSDQQTLTGHQIRHRQIAGDAGGARAPPVPV